MVMWMNQSFLLLEDVKERDDGSLRVRFECLRQTGDLVVDCSPDCHVTITSDNMDLVADLVQSLAQYLNIDDLEVR